MKRCPKCGETKEDSEYYTDTISKKNPRGLSCYCKECTRIMKREAYKAKTPGKAYWCKDEGRYKVRNSTTGASIFWSPQMIALLRRYFPVTRNEEVAGMIGVSPRTMSRKAKELGLEKDKTFLHQVWAENRTLAVSISKKYGNPGWFQKGHYPLNAFKKKSERDNNDTERELQVAVG